MGKMGISFPQLFELQGPIFLVPLSADKASLGVLAAGAATATASLGTCLQVTDIDREIDSCLDPFSKFDFSPQYCCYLLFRVLR